MRLQGKLIYVADDDEHVLEVITTILQDEGATVIKGSDGQQIFTSATFGKPDCIIMDLYMPGYDGFQSMEALKDILSVKCPILVLTGHATEENIAKAKQMGATECLSKPLRARELVDTILRLMAANPPD